MQLCPILHRTLARTEDCPVLGHELNRFSSKVKLPFKTVENKLVHVYFLLLRELIDFKDSCHS